MRSRAALEKGYGPFSGTAAVEKGPYPFSETDKMSAMRQGLLVAVVLFSACAPKLAPAPVVTAPKFPDFMRPALPPAYAGTAAAAGESRGWAFLQAGDFKSAERELSATLKAEPAFYPAEISLGYVALAQKDSKGALAHFDRALELSPEHTDVSALIGRGQALLGLNRDVDALAAFEAAVAADPSQTDLARRVEVLRFRTVEQRLARARDAAKAGRLDEANQAYLAAIASSPDSPFLYRELAGVERQMGHADAALEHLRQAIELDPSDAASLAQTGEILEDRGDFEAAAKAYASSLAIEPNAAVEARVEAARARSALALLPAEYRALDQASQITRADLAALVGIRLGTLLQNMPQANPALITDVRNNWAAPWIMAVARAGIMEPFANHAFQPRAVVRRVDLAQTVARLLARAAVVNPGRVKTFESARLKFSDLSPGHLAYPAASAAVAAGVLTTGPGNSFQPSRPVTGAEAIDALTRIEALAGLGTRP
jgi:tetratricopeptide (TPR) repeat protein